MQPPLGSCNPLLEAVTLPDLRLDQDDPSGLDKQNAQVANMFRSILLATQVSVAVPLGAVAQTADDLKNDDKTPGDVPTYGMSHSRQRFSPLSQINRDNVKRLVPAWFYIMGQ
jgi:glucose dehydrogenase